MSVPFTKTYYCSTGSYPGTTFGDLNVTNPPSTNTTWGWIVGQNNPPLYCQMNRNIEVARTSVQWLSAPSTDSPNQNTGGSGAGNGWIFGPLDGEFVSGNWQITMSVKATTNAAGQDGQFIYRIWTCESGSGANPSLVTSSFISSSSVTNLTTTPTALTTSVFLPRINLRGNGYVFLQTYWSILGASTQNGGDVDYVFGLTGSLVTTAPFVTSQARLVTWGHDEDS